MLLIINRRREVEDEKINYFMPGLYAKISYLFEIIIGGRYRDISNIQLIQYIFVLNSYL